MKNRAIRNVIISDSESSIALPNDERIATQLKLNHGTGADIQANLSFPSQFSIRLNPS